MAGRPRKNNKEVETKSTETVEVATKTKEIKEEVIEKKTGRLSGKMRVKSDTINTDNLDKKRRVPVVSVCSGMVGYQCKLSPNFLMWEEYGDENEMAIEELLLMYSQSKSFLTDPIILVDDEEFAETFKLTDKYASIFDTEDLNIFYRGNNANAIKNKILDLPEGIRKQVLTRTVIAINKGELNNLTVIKMLKKEFDLDVEIF